MAGLPKKLSNFLLIQYFIVKNWILVTHNGMDISEIIPLLVTHSTVFILLEKNTWLIISGAGFESFMLFYLLRNRYVLLKKPAPNIFILNLIFCEKNIHFVFYIYWLANIRHLPVWPQYEANKYDKILAPWSNCSLTCSNKTLKTLHWKP